MAELQEMCVHRWLNHLDPSINHGKWTQAENIVLVQKQAELGNHWSKIRQYLPGRPDNSIKNQWHWVLKRRVEAARAAGTMPSLVFAADSRPLPEPAQPPAHSEEERAEECDDADTEAGHADASAVITVQPAIPKVGHSSELQHQQHHNHRFQC